MQGELQKKALQIIVVLLSLLFIGGALGSIILANSSIPGEPLYQIKLVSERIQGAFKKTPEEKAQYSLDLSYKRLAEVNLLVDKVLKTNQGSVKGTNNGQVLQESTDSAEVDLSQYLRLTSSKILDRAEKILTEVERSEQSVRELARDARIKNDAIQLACLNEKLIQIGASRKILGERMRLLREAIETKDSSTINHEFIMIVVIGERVARTLDEANQCVGAELAISGETEVKVEVDDLPPISDETQEPEIEALFNEKEKTTFEQTLQLYKNVLSEVDALVGQIKNSTVLFSFIKQLSDHKKQFLNLASMVGTQETRYLFDIAPEIMRHHENWTNQLAKIDSKEADRVLQESVKDNFTELTKAARVLNGSNQNKIFERRLLIEKDFYEDGIRRYEDYLYDGPFSAESYQKFTENLFSDWLEFNKLLDKSKNKTLQEGLNELTQTNKIYETASIETVAQKDRTQAIELVLNLLDKHIVLLKNQDDTLVEILMPDTQERYNVAVVYLKDPSGTILAPKLLLLKQEFVRRSIIYAVELHSLKQALSTGEAKLIDSVIGDISDGVKETIADIKEQDPQLYQAKRSAYQPLSQGLSPGLLQGLQAGIQAGLQAGMQAGMQTGLQAGMQAGIQGGLQAGLYQGILQEMYQSSSPLINVPGNASGNAPSNAPVNAPGNAPVNAPGNTSGNAPENAPANAPTIIPTDYYTAPTSFTLPTETQPTQPASSTSAPTTPPAEPTSYAPPPTMPLPMPSL